MKVRSQYQRISTLKRQIRRISYHWTNREKIASDKYHLWTPNPNVSTSYISATWRDAKFYSESYATFRIIWGATQARNLLSASFATRNLLKEGLKAATWNSAKNIWMQVSYRMNQKIFYKNLCHVLPYPNPNVMNIPWESLKQTFILIRLTLRKTYELRNKGWLVFA